MKLNTAVSYIPVWYYDNYFCIHLILNLMSQSDNVAKFECNLTNFFVRMDFINLLNWTEAHILQLKRTIAISFLIKNNNNNSSLPLVTVSNFLSAQTTFHLISSHSNTKAHVFLSDIDSVSRNGWDLTACYFHMLLSCWLL